MSSKRKRRRRVVEACEAVRRDPHRAACIEALSIRLTRLSSFKYLLRRPLRCLAEALAVLPNLRALRIQPYPYHTEHLSRILCSPLNGRHPFRLTTFASVGALHDAIGPFVRSQSAITDYSIYGDAMSSDAKNKKDDRNRADVDRTRCLPNIRRFKGSSYHVRGILGGRSVDIVEVTEYGVEDDIQRLYTDFYRFPRAKRDEIITGDGRQTIASNVCLNLWFRAEEQHHFPFLISVSHKISISDIRSLKVRSWDMLNHDTVPPALKLFPILEFFEWDSPDYMHELREDWLRKFVLDCVENVPRIRRITFCDTRGPCNYHTWSRVPVDSLTPDDDSITPVEHPSTSQVTLVSSSSSMRGALTKMTPIRDGSSFAWKLETREAGCDDPDNHWEIGS